MVLNNKLSRCTPTQHTQKRRHQKITQVAMAELIVTSTDKECQTLDFPQFKPMNSIVYDAFNLRRTISSKPPLIRSHYTDNGNETSLEIDSSGNEDLEVITEDTPYVDWTIAFAVELQRLIYKPKTDCFTQTDTQCLDPNLLFITGFETSAQSEASYRSYPSIEEKNNNPQNGRKRPQPRTTKVDEFQFSRRSGNYTVKGQICVSKLIGEFIAQPNKNIKKHAVLSKKNLLKQICSLFHSAKQKNRSNENIAEFVFEELTLKYSIVDIAKRKLKEFLASGAAHHDSRRIRLFLRALGAGSLVYEKDLTLLGSNLVTQCYRSFLPNLGNSEGESQVVSFNKVLECLKEYIEPAILKTEFNELVGNLEGKCIEDPYKMSKQRHIDLDTFIELSVNSFENYCEGVIEGINFLSTEFFVASPLLIPKTEFFIATRSLHPNEDAQSLVAELEEIKDEFLNELTEFPSFYYSAENLKKFCIKKKIFHRKLIDSNLSVNQHNSCEWLDSEIQSLQQIFASLDESTTEQCNSLTPSLLTAKLALLSSYVSENSRNSALLLHCILSSESKILASHN